MRRRQLISGSAGALVGLSGCIGLPFDDATPTRLCEVSILDQYSEPVRIDLKIAEGETVHVDESTRMGSSGDRNELYTLQEDLPPEPGHYRITLRIAGDGWERREEFRTIDGELETVDVVWVVYGSTTGEDGPQIQLLTSQESSECR